MKILLPIDGSELSLHEVRFALRLVREGLQASFLLVNVQEPSSLYEIVTWPDIDGPTLMFVSIVPPTIVMVLAGTTRSSNEIRLSAERRRWRLVM